MTSAQVVETSVTITNSSFQNYTHPDDHTGQTTDTPGFKPFTTSNYVAIFGGEERGSLLPLLGGYFKRRPYFWGGGGGGGHCFHGGRYIRNSNYISEGFFSHPLPCEHALFLGFTYKRRSLSTDVLFSQKNANENNKPRDMTANARRLGDDSRTCFARALVRSSEKKIKRLWTD